MDTPRSPYYSTPPQFSRPPQNMSLKAAHAVNVPHVMPTNIMMWPVGANGKPKPKPKRPFTPYNLFYLLERELVVQKINGPPKSSGIKRRYAGMPPREEDQIKPPSRYEKIIMAPYWYDPNMKEKRKHRKTPGMISFKELTGIISANWAVVDKETKDYVTIVSELGRKRYKDEMNRFNTAQKAIELQKKAAEAVEAAKADASRKMGENQKKPPVATKVVHVGSPVRRNTTSTQVKSIPVTPDRTLSSGAYKHSPSIVNPHGYHHPNLPIMYPQRYGITQLPPPLPPPMPSNMPPPPNMPSPHQQRSPRHFKCDGPVKISKNDSNFKVEKDATSTTTSRREAKMPHDGQASHLNSLMDHEFMNFEPDHVIEEAFDQGNVEPLASPHKNAADEDILDMIKGDVWDIDMDHFNYDDEPFKFEVHY